VSIDSCSYPFCQGNPTSGATYALAALSTPSRVTKLLAQFALVREVRRALAIILARWNNRPGHAAGLDEGAVPLLEQHAHQGERPVKAPAAMFYLIRIPLAVSGAGGSVYFEFLLQARGPICTVAMRSSLNTIVCSC